MSMSERYEVKRLELELKGRETEVLFRHREEWLSRIATAIAHNATDAYSAEQVGDELHVEHHRLLRKLADNDVQMEPSSESEDLDKAVRMLEELARREFPKPGTVDPIVTPDVKAEPA